MSLNFFRRALSRLGAVMIVPGPLGLFRREAMLDAGSYQESKDLYALLRQRYRWKRGIFQALQNKLYSLIAEGSPRELAIGWSVWDDSPRKST